MQEKKDLIEKKGMKKKLDVFYNKDEADRERFSFIITMGGDGTILYASKQFAGNYFPPLISFSQGSLGFLANFTFEEYPKVLTAIFRSQRNGN